MGDSVFTSVSESIFSASESALASLSSSPVSSSSADKIRFFGDVVLFERLKYPFGAQRHFLGNARQRRDLYPETAVCPAPRDLPQENHGAV